MTESALSSVLSHLSPDLKEDAARATAVLVSSPETLLWAGDVRDLDRYRGFRFGYMFITSRHLIWVLFNPEIDDGGCFGLLLGLVLLGLFAPEPKPKRPNLEMKFLTGGENLGLGFVVGPLSSPLTRDELSSRTTEEYPLKDLSALERKEYPFRWEADRALTELKLQFHPDRRIRVGFLNPTYAQEAYQLLQAHRQEQTGRQGDAPQIADQLEKLAELYRYQTISEEEYIAAKRRLLGTS